MIKLRGADMPRWTVGGWGPVWPVTAFYTYPESVPAYTNKINALP